MESRHFVTGSIYKQYGNIEAEDRIKRMIPSVSELIHIKNGAAGAANVKKIYIDNWRLLEDNWLNIIIIWSVLFIGQA